VRDIVERRTAASAEDQAPTCRRDGDQVPSTRAPRRAPPEAAKHGDGGTGAVTARTPRGSRRRRKVTARSVVRRVAEATADGQADRGEPRRR
jgi:hypothetical protein